MSRFVPLKQYGGLNFAYDQRSGFYVARIPAANVLDKATAYSVMFDGKQYNYAAPQNGALGNAYLYSRRFKDTGEPFYFAPAMGMVISDQSGIKGLSYGILKDDEVVDLESLAEEVERLSEEIEELKANGGGSGGGSTKVIEHTETLLAQSEYVSSVYSPDDGMTVKSIPLNLRVDEGKLALIVGEMYKLRIGNRIMEAVAASYAPEYGVYVNYQEGEMSLFATDYRTGTLRFWLYDGFDNVSIGDWNPEEIEFSGKFECLGDTADVVRITIYDSSIVCQVNGIEVPGYMFAYAPLDIRLALADIKISKDAAINVAEYYIPLRIFASDIHREVTSANIKAIDYKRDIITIDILNNSISSGGGVG